MICIVSVSHLILALSFAVGLGLNLIPTRTGTFRYILWTTKSKLLCLTADSNRWQQSKGWKLIRYVIPDNESIKNPLSLTDGSEVSRLKQTTLATFLFVCDTLRCTAMPRLAPDCDVTHFDWQLQCSACFNSFLSGDSTAPPWESCRPCDTHANTQSFSTKLQTSSVSLRCLPAAEEAAGYELSSIGTQASIYKRCANRTTDSTDHYIWAHLIWMIQQHQALTSESTWTLVVNKTRDHGYSQ